MVDLILLPNLFLLFINDLSLHLLSAHMLTRSPFITHFILENDPLNSRQLILGGWPWNNLSLIFLVSLVWTEKSWLFSSLKIQFPHLSTRHLLRHNRNVTSSKMNNSNLLLYFIFLVLFFFSSEFSYKDHFTSSQLLAIYRDIIRPCVENASISGECNTDCIP